MTVTNATFVCVGQCVNCICVPSRSVFGRSEILNLFYGTAAGSVEKLQKVNQRTAAERKAAYEALNVTTFTTLELIELLTARDDTLKTRAACEIQRRLLNAEKVTKEKLKKDLRENGLKPLLLTLSRPPHALHKASLDIISEVVDCTFVVVR